MQQRIFYDRGRHFNNAVIVLCNLLTWIGFKVFFSYFLCISAVVANNVM